MAEFFAEFGIIPYWLRVVLQSEWIHSGINVGKVYRAVCEYVSDWLRIS